MSDSNKEGENKKKDLTRIEDLSEFLHQEDPDAEAFLTDGSDQSEDDPGEEAQNLDDLPDLPGEEREESDDDQDASSSDSSSGSDDEVNFDEETSPNLEEQEAFQEFDPFSSDGQDGENEETPETSFEQEDDDIFGGGEEKDNQFEDQGDFGDSPFQENQEEDTPFGESQDFSDFSEDEESQEQSQNDQDNDDSPFETESIDDSSFDESEGQSLDEQEGLQEQDSSEDTEEQNAEQESNVLDFEESQNSAEKNQETATQEDPPSQKPRSSKRENFQEVREFGTHMTYGHVAAEGNPPFSIAIRNIQYQEDAEDILSLMREHGLLTDQNEKQMRQSVEMGALLISQISEYSAIYLGHKLRRYSVSLQIGPAEEIHPPKSYTNEDVGLSSKSGLRKGRVEGVNISTKGLSIEDILVSTSEKLPGWKTVSYLGIITESANISESDLRNSMDLSDVESDNEEKELQEGFQDQSLATNHTYQSLLKELKKKALKQNANGVLNISFQLNPLVKKNTDDEVIYQVTCTGNLVQIQKQE